MHPSNRDHKDMQEGGVSQARGCVGGMGGCQGQAEMDGCVGGGAHEIKSEERAGHPCYRPIAVKVEARCFRVHLWTYEIRRSSEGFKRCVQIKSE